MGITSIFPGYKTIGLQEIFAAVKVLTSGRLSGFLGTAGGSFLGGSHVQKFEEAAAKHFGSTYCVSFNSWSSGLFCAVGALGIKPGDEVLVPSWTMSASATAITHWGGVPVFVDIEARTYTLDLQKLEDSITNRTVGIVIVDIFGNPSNYKGLREFAKNRGLWTLGDCAQAPGATVGDEHVASLSDIGGYSLNRHKHIQTGEGGFALTDDYDLATKMRLMRNHAEQVTADKEYVGYYKIAGHNFRLGELEAAMALPQLHKLSDRVRTRRRAAKILASSLSRIPSFIVPSSDDYGKSAYYLFPLIFSDMSTERRARFVEALKKAGIPGLVVRYQNIHRLPFFTSLEGVGNRQLPVSEKLYDSTFVGIQLCSSSFGRVQAQLVARAIHKAVMAST